MAASPAPIEPTKVRSKAVPASERLLLDTIAAAELLSVTPRALEKLPILRINLPGVKGVRWRKADLEEYVRSFG